jgi:shikimate 5-dehydrogenase
MVPLVVPDGVSAPDVLAGLAPLRLQAVIVASDFQDVVGQALDEIEAGACRRGTVNLIVAQGGRLVGCWTDGEGETMERLDGLTVPA